MKNDLVLSLFTMFFVISGLYCQQQDREAIDIIPQPVSIKRTGEKFIINGNTNVFVSSNLDDQTGDVLKGMLDAAVGYPLKPTEAKNKTGQIKFIVNEKEIPDIGQEGYTVDVSGRSVTITANQSRGLFYGLQSFLQMLPPSGNEVEKKMTEEIVVSGVEIVDYPRFEWRGVMLDVSRHFFPKEVVKSLIDQIARYKFNKFHLHLTDDQGWRIEIEGLPKLTSVGAWRVPRTGGRFMHYEKPEPGEEATYGGFYTQEEIREIVTYAQERQITVIPEIDVPAHSLALIASYPSLSCSQKPMYVSPGSPLTVEEPNVLCVANDSTYIVLDKIFDQVADLFPGEYIHMGGDEAYKGFWKNCDKCQNLMDEHGLENTGELQSFFVKKVEKIISSKKKKMIGWEEIMKGGLAPNAAIMSWTSVDAGIKASNMGHQVVMTPWDNGLYMDSSRIQRSYDFDPVPENANPDFIMGAQGALWTEHVPNVREMQRMYWPRLMALSEVFWTPARKKNWDNFTDRLEAHLPRLDAKNIKYSKQIYDPIIMDDWTTGELKIKLDSEIPDLDIYYSFDGTEPDNFYPKYEGGLLTPPKGSLQIQTVTYRNGEQIGRQVERSLESFERQSEDNDDSE